MNKTSNALAKAQQIIEDNLAQACADALELKATGLLPQGPLNEALEVLKHSGINSGTLRLAESIVQESAMRSVLSQHKHLSLQVLPY